MNNLADLSRRLLSMLPLASLKQHWGVVGGRKDQLIHDRAATMTKRQVWELAFELFPFFKQHLFIYAHDVARVPPIATSVVQSGDLVNNTVSGNVCVQDIMVEVRFDVTGVNGVTVQTQQIKFFWPIRVTIESKRLTVAIVLLEKDLAAHLGHGWRVLSATRSKDEKAVLAEVVAGTPQSILLTPLDLQKGVKHMWDTDLVDAPLVTIKNSSSTRTESMDGTTTFKSRYPNDYRQIISKPLLETIFTPIGPNSDLYPRSFRVNPSVGEFTFAYYPQNADAIQNVVREILRNN